MNDSIKIVDAYSIEALNPTSKIVYPVMNAFAVI